MEENDQDVQQPNNPIFYDDDDDEDECRVCRGPAEEG